MGSRLQGNNLVQAVHSRQAVGRTVAFVRGDVAAVSRSFRSIDGHHCDRFSELLLAPPKFQGDILTVPDLRNHASTGWDTRSHVVVVKSDER